LKKELFFTGDVMADGSRTADSGSGEPICLMNTLAAFRLRISICWLFDLGATQLLTLLCASK